MSYLYWIIVLLLISGCRHHRSVPANKLFVQSDVSEVTTLAFNNTIPPDTSIKRYLPDVLFSVTEQEKSEDFKAKLDTIILTVFIRDTLIRLPSIYLQKSIADYKTDSRDKFKKYNLLRNWGSEIVIDGKPGIFQMTNIRFDDNYLYKLQSSYRKTDDVKYIASLFKTSAVFFNADKTKAFVYTERHGGTVIAIGYDLYFEKKNGKWLLVYKDMAWVS
jgi:hypothetical protein